MDTVSWKVENVTRGLDTLLLVLPEAGLGLEKGRRLGLGVG